MNTSRLLHRQFMPLGAEGVFLFVSGGFCPAQLSVKVMCKVPETALVEMPPKAPDIQTSGTLRQVFILFSLLCQAMKPLQYKIVFNCHWFHCWLLELTEPQKVNLWRTQPMQTNSACLHRLGSSQIGPTLGDFFFNPPSLQDNWFGMTLNVMDPDGVDGRAWPGAAWDAYNLSLCFDSSKC